MIKLLTRPFYAGIITIIVFSVSVSVAIALNECDGGLIASAGAIATMFGILLMTRSLLKFNSAQDVFEDREFKISKLDPLPSNREEEIASEKKYESAKKQKIQEIRSEIIGVYYLIFGTIIWAYGERLFDQIMSC